MIIFKSPELLSASKILNNTYILMIPEKSLLIVQIQLSSLLGWSFLLIL